MQRISRLQLHSQQGIRGPVHDLELVLITHNMVIAVVPRELRRLILDPFVLGRLLGVLLRYRRLDSRRYGRHTLIASEFFLERQWGRWLRQAGILEGGWCVAKVGGKHARKAVNGCLIFWTVREVRLYRNAMQYCFPQGLERMTIPMVPGAWTGEGKY